jgi:hypothetical protein
MMGASRWDADEFAGWRLHKEPVGKSPVSPPPPRGPLLTRSLSGAICSPPGPVSGLASVLGGCGRSVRVSGFAFLLVQGWGLTLSLAAKHSPP